MRYYFQRSFSGVTLKQPEISPDRSLAKEEMGGFHPLHIQVDRWCWGLLLFAVLLALTACSGAASPSDPSPTPTEAAAPNSAPPGAEATSEASQAPPPSDPQNATLASTPPAPSPTPVPLVVMQLPNVADIVEQVRPAVVSIVAEEVVIDLFGRSRSRFGSGTGVIVSPRGLVLTNNHVIEGARDITITPDDGAQVKAEIVGTDRLSDLAVLQIEGERDNYPFLPVSRNVHLRVGEWVIAIGNALALPGGPTVTVGVVSALGRTIEAGAGITLYDLIQTDTVINPGNSGGPLINLRGELVGINTAVLRGSSVSGTTIEGIGFAINMETAALVSEQLIELGRVRWAWLGVFLADLEPQVAAQTGVAVRDGVLVQDVVLGGPSDRAGMRRGDIILSLGGHKVQTVRDLTRILRQEFQVGHTIDVELFRGGSRLTVQLELGERPT